MIINKPPKKIISLLSIVILAAILLSFFSYQYYNSISNKILGLASEDIRSNAKIEAHDFAKILENQLDVIYSGVQTLAIAPAIKNNETERAHTIINLRQDSTKGLTDFYMWLDESGKLLWISNMNQTSYQKYKGTDLSYRDYFNIPKQTYDVYYSSVIESNDNIPRLYISIPVLADNNTKSTTDAGDISNNGNNTNKTFKGIVAAAIRSTVIGNMLKNDLPSGFESRLVLMDKNGLLLFSRNQSHIGKDIFGKEFQSTITSIIPEDNKNQLNSILRQAIEGKNGTSDLIIRGQKNTIAYNPVLLNGEHVLTLYILAPHILTSNVAALVEEQKNFGIALTTIIGAVTATIVFITLKWNKKLKDIVNQRTRELVLQSDEVNKINVFLQESNKKLEEANEHLKIHDKMQKEFINVASHELRTPIQAILGYSQLLKSHPDRKDEISQGIWRNAVRLQRLTSDILDITRIESNTLKLNKEKFNLSDLIFFIAKDYSNTNQSQSEKSIKIVYENHKDNNFVVEGDKSRLTQIISNIIDNAIKFTNDLGTCVYIITEKGTKDNEVVVSVKDKGTGIDKEIMPKLFTKFVSKSEKGIGLGLYICKKIIEAHGGNIWAQNNPDGKGATFSFSLPLYNQNNDQTNHNEINYPHSMNQSLKQI